MMEEAKSKIAAKFKNAYIYNISNDTNIIISNVPLLSLNAFTIITPSNIGIIK